ncbi:MAG: TetR family transcriptional regulator C-terminal domain-containing protein, partial [Alphaproteobacteria bacterium]|nr:TetR family transcriptional regulator C-terminal domain-containing protein [Alphaproteobacteria bacterium]
HDPAKLAAIFWIGWEGAVLRAKLEQGPDPLILFADGFFAMLN